MKKTISMPDVSECTVSKCAYNRDRGCHARAITVGGADDHCCDTMFAGSSHVHRRGEAGVGACRVTTCKHNKDLECMAESIQIGMARGEVVCRSFQRV